MTNAPFRYFHLLGVGIVYMFLSPNLAVADEPLEDFRTTTGLCSVTENSDLLKKNQELIPSYSYTLDNTDIEERRGFAPKTGAVIPALTRVHCLAAVQEKMLITAADSTKGFCGWVKKDQLLKTKATASLALVDLSPCGVVKPMSISKYCLEMQEIQGPTPGCELSPIGESVINTKFVTDNTSSKDADGKRTVKTEEIDVYPSAQAQNSISAVKIFNIFEVFDLEKNNNTDNVRLLVGLNGTALKGWVDARSGTVWYSNLSTYFSAEGNKDVYHWPIGAPNNQVLAERPKNMESQLVGKSEFARYPVLFDYRLKDENSPSKIKPHLQIAYIGRFCSKDRNSFCSSAAVESTPSSGNPNSADIMFLIDGTKSMKEYFKLVSKAVSEFTDDYIDNPDFRFGVAMYGDFKDITKKETTDALDFKIVDKLQINDGYLFGKLGNTNLFIKDAMKDKSEPTNAAIYNTVERVDWDGKKPRFLIHIADHGDRVNPSPLTLKSLKEKNIFYIPVAVKGENITAQSADFVRQSNLIYDQHLTPKGLPMAVKPLITYKNLGDMDEYNSIVQALVGSLNVGPDIMKNILRDGLDGARNPSEDTGSTLPDGFAILTDAARELFMTEELETGFTNIAAKGFIETRDIGKEERDWDYFVTLDRNELYRLNRSMEAVCEAIGSSDDLKIITESAKEMIETLTGDRLSDADLGVYWTNRKSIPLVNQTLLGDGMQKFLTEYTNPEKLSEYRKAFCRGYELTNLMQEGKKLPNPYDGGSMQWKGGFYETKDHMEHDWIYTDIFDRGYYYVPLNYLPGWSN